MGSLARRLATLPNIVFLKALAQGLPVIWPGAVDMRRTPSDDGQILPNLRSHSMTAADFRRIALSLEGVEEYSHAGLPGFRARRQEICLAGLASRGVWKSDAYAGAAGCVCGGGARDFSANSWGLGKDGHTHIRLAAASEDVLTGALRTAWRVRIDKNAKTSRRKPRG